MTQNPVTATTLPQWLVDELPEPKPVATIYWNDKYQRFGIRGKGAGYFADITSAYENLLSSNDHSIEFDASVEGHQGKLIGEHFYLDNKDLSHRQQRLRNTKDSQRESLQHEYALFLNEIDAQYRARPDDITVAYRWLNHHPMSWYKLSQGSSSCWITDEGLGHSRSDVSRGSDGSLQVTVEHGPHDDQDYTHRYLDIRLTQKGNGFEDAYIKLAARVDMFYHTDGTPKPNVEYEKSEFELFLEQDAQLSNGFTLTECR